MVVKNYKELCSLLKEPVRTSDSKQAQMKEWGRYFKFHKQRNKQSIVIDEIYPSSLQKTVQKPGRKPIYQEHLSNILVNYLLAQNGHTATMTSQRWYYALGMVNENYNKLTSSEIKQYDKSIKEHNIEAFYQICNNKLRKTFLSTLNSLKKQGIIDYEELVFIKYNDYSDVSYLATEGCLDSIEYAQQEALSEIGIKSISELYKQNKFYEYNLIFNDLLSSLYGIQYIYRKFKVKYICGDINNVLSHNGLEDNRLELNDLLRSYMDSSAEKYQEKLKEAYYNGVLLYAPEHYSDTQKSISKLLMQIKRRKKPLYDWRDYIDENREYIDFKMYDLMDEDSNEPVQWISPDGYEMPNLSPEELRQIKPETSEELDSLFEIAL